MVENWLTKPSFQIQYFSLAGVAELADALRSGRSELMLIWVRLPSSAQESIVLRHKKSPVLRGFFRLNKTIRGIIGVDFLR